MAGKVYMTRTWEGKQIEERCPATMTSNEAGTHKAQPCNVFVFCPTRLAEGGLCWSNDVWNHSYGALAPSPEFAAHQRCSARRGATVAASAALRRRRSAPPCRHRGWRCAWQASAGSRTSETPAGPRRARTAPTPTATARSTTPRRRRCSGCRARSPRPSSRSTGPSGTGSGVRARVVRLLAAVDG